MNRLKMLALATVMTGAAAVPALADYVRLGTVDVGYRTDRDANFVRFAGGLEGLRLTADRSDISCSNIVVTYGNRARENVFHGVLREDRPVNIDLAGGSRRVTRIDFKCRSDEFRGGKITINGDVGRYRDEWRRDPYWAGIWASIFGLDDRGRDRHDRGDRHDRDTDWITLGRQNFEGRRDRENSVTGWTGRSIDRVGLRAVNNSAVCRRVVARFANGEQADLGRRLSLNQSETLNLDLPGRVRNLTSINLACHATHGRRVTIEIVGRTRR